MSFPPRTTHTLIVWHICVRWCKEQRKLFECASFPPCTQWYGLPFALYMDWPKWTHKKPWALAHGWSAHPHNLCVTHSIKPEFPESFNVLRLDSRSLVRQLKHPSSLCRCRLVVFRIAMGRLVLNSLLGSLSLALCGYPLRCCVRVSLGGAKYYVRETLGVERANVVSESHPWWSGGTNLNVGHRTIYSASTGRTYIYIQ